jgi:group I intron endonuclease
MGYIYLRTNKINGKKYVGQTKDIKDRNRKWNNLNCKYGGCVINNARKKYGVDGFSFELLKECPNEEMNYWEMYYIKQYNSKKPYGYNATDGGDSTYERTDEIKKKISATLKTSEKAKIARTKAAAALRGRKQSPETIEKRAAAHRGKKLSEETKAKISDANKGKKRTEEAKAKIAAAHRGKKRPDIAAAKRGKPNPKHAAALRGKYNTKKSKAIQAFDKDGNVVMEFPSTQEAERQGYGNHSLISKCCLGKRKSHGGFIWRFAV